MCYPKSSVLCDRKKNGTWNSDVSFLLKKLRKNSNQLAFFMIQKKKKKTKLRASIVPDPQYLPLIVKSP